MSLSKQPLSILETVIDLKCINIWPSNNSTGLELLLTWDCLHELSMANCPRLHPLTILKHLTATA